MAPKGPKRKEADPSDVIIIPEGSMHAVIDNPEPRLSLTINVSG